MSIIKTSTALKIQQQLYYLLNPLGVIYSQIMRLRVKSYQYGLYKSYLAPVPCISVGNISWGGTGKTPITSYLLEWAAALGLNAAVLTRGYGGKPKSLPLLISSELSRSANGTDQAQANINAAQSSTDSTQVSIDAAQAGDEPLLLALKHPSATIIVDPKRARAAQLIASEIKNASGMKGANNADIKSANEAKLSAINLIIMDDGFQHLALKRDLNFVLLRQDDFDAKNWNKVIPAGTWREGQEALGRASVFLCKTNQNLGPNLSLEQTELFKQKLKPFQRPLFTFHLKAAGFRLLSGKHNSSQGGDASELSLNLEAQNYVFMSGVARPEEVLASVENFLGYPPAQQYFYEDHHPFSLAEFNKMLAHSLPIVCTAKDAVKLMPFLDKKVLVPIYIFESNPCFSPCLFTNQSFDSWLGQAWEFLFKKYN